jgi:hypothetical protein
MSEQCESDWGWDSFCAKSIFLRLYDITDFSRSHDDVIVVTSLW